MVRHTPDMRSLGWIPASILMEKRFFAPNMTGTIPREIQLHGYGNERHGDHKQFKHTIPQKVRDFCDRWERDVLTPWFADQKAQQAGVKKKPHKARKMA